MIEVTPQDETFIVYTDADVPPSIAKELEDSMHESYGLKVPAMLDNLSQRLRAALKGSHAAGDDEGVEEEGEGEDRDEEEDVVMTDTDDLDLEGDSDEDDGGIGSDFEYSDNELFGIQGGDTPVARKATSLGPSTMHHIRRDFRTVRQAGFKVGILCGFHEYQDQSIVSISVRVDKLCLSDETLRAWDLDPSEFIVLLIKYTDHYITFEDALSEPGTMSNIKFCLRRCSAYKPTLPQVISAFSTASQSQKPTQSASSAPDQPGAADPYFSLLSIGTSIDMFMNKDFISLLKLRIHHNMSWDDAKEYLSLLLKSTLHDSDQDPPPRPQPSEPDRRPGDLPAFLVEEENGDNKSPGCLPLTAMKFAMRYLVRCVDYCMICHRRVGGNFEALKPYVCGDSLCLFQYMSLGFGPSVEYEILKQPFVVDLLISFCYSSLATRTDGKYRIREFPTGLSLSVPNIRVARPTPLARSTPLARPTSNYYTDVDPLTFVEPREVFFDRVTTTVLAKPGTDFNGLKEGQWVALLILPSDPALAHVPPTNPPLPTRHGILGSGSQIDSSTDDVITRRSILGHAAPVMRYARIETVGHKKVQLDPASLHAVSNITPANEVDKTDPSRAHAQMILFDQNLDDLEEHDKAFAMQKLLLALPRVSEMRAYLNVNPNQQLSKWEKMVPSSLVLLRWIVASNRSYILQMDKCADDKHRGDFGAVSREREKIRGVDGWTQFRFAQGSPEKEALFQEALENINKPQRTILAWHGSTLGNWHSIIRQGLDYQVMEHGRAYGHGVYFGRSFETSRGYSNHHPGGFWPNSDLKIQDAIGLVELVNNPEQFRKISPHFVVQHCHWIQCRYLFVRALSDPILPSFDGNVAHPTTQPPALTAQEEFVQDPKWVATGPMNSHLSIPKIAIPSASGNKAKFLSISRHDAKGHSGDTGDEDEGDMEFLVSDDDRGATRSDRSRSGSSRPGFMGSLPPTPGPTASLDPKTNFQPGTLDLSSLPILKPPSYATGPAQKAVQRELKKLQQVQSTTPLPELGWYMDFDAVDNMFQWIVELHSFDLELPLGQDMQRLGINSIVLEIRFGRDFPMTPPFVRVIRPRFLPFLEGGGGHVTAGGAMCMELLATEGWSPVNSLESVLVQVRVALCSTEPRPARLRDVRRARGFSHGPADYGVDEAFEAYARAARTHGWRVPADQMEMRNATELVKGTCAHIPGLR